MITKILNYVSNIESEYYKNKLIGLIDLCNKDETEILKNINITKDADGDILELYIKNSFYGTIYDSLYSDNKVLLQKLYNLKDIDIKRAIASNNKCPTEILIRLAEKEDDVDIKTNLASNDRIPEIYLIKWANEDDFFIKKAILLNNNCPIEILEKFKNDSSNYISKIATGKLALIEEMI